MESARSITKGFKSVESQIMSSGLYFPRNYALLGFSRHRVFLLLGGSIVSEISFFRTLEDRVGQIIPHYGSCHPKAVGKGRNLTCIFLGWEKSFLLRPHFTILSVYDWSPIEFTNPTARPIAVRTNDNSTIRMSPNNISPKDYETFIHQ